MSAGVFERHLDLRPLRGRRRGLVRCVFHRPDRRGSLSVDLARGLFHCFACGAQGGVKAFAALVGEPPLRSSMDRSPRRPAPRESARAQAWREVMRRERRLEAWRHESAPYWAVSDFIRRCARLVREARGAATALGPEDARTWPLLERAAHVERAGWAAEAELDAILAEGRTA